jgi:hypothetical protein
LRLLWWLGALGVVAGIAFALGRWGVVWWAAVAIWVLAPIERIAVGYELAAADVGRAKVPGPAVVMGFGALVVAGVVFVAVAPASLAPLVPSLGTVVVVALLTGFDEAVERRNRARLGWSAPDPAERVATLSRPLPAPGFPRPTSWTADMPAWAWWVAGAMLLVGIATFVTITSVAGV